MLSHHTQARSQLDIKLHAVATDKRKHNVGIHGYHVTHHVILKVHVRKTHTKSGIVQVLLPRTLLHSRELDTEVQTTVLVQTESFEVVVLVEVRALECLYLDGELRFVTFILCQSQCGKQHHAQQRCNTAFHCVFIIYVFVPNLNLILAASLQNGGKVTEIHRDEQMI